MLRLRVKEVMEAKGLTMTRLSRLADVNYKTIVGIVRDPYREVEYKTLYKIAKALGVEVGELIEEVGEE
jgi:transcriptional regulator with XRE-family HTH domain